MIGATCLASRTAFTFGPAAASSSSSRAAKASLRPSGSTTGSGSAGLPFSFVLGV